MREMDGKERWMEMREMVDERAMNSKKREVWQRKEIDADVAKRETGD